MVTVDPVNAAKAAWDVIEGGRPVTSSDTDYADALPAGADFTQLTGWLPAPQVERIAYQCKKFGRRLADVTLACVWYYNGQYYGRGRYIGHAHIAVSRLSASWQQKVDVRADIGTPMNAGNPAEPIAVLPIAITLHRRGLTNSETRSWQLSVRGDGRFEVLQL